MDHCDGWLDITKKIFPGRNYHKILIDFEKIQASVSLMNFMKQSGRPTDEVNMFIAEINRMGVDPQEVRKIYETIFLYIPCLIVCNSRSRPELVQSHQVNTDDSYRGA